jgi:hypothetical protein
MNVIKILHTIKKIRRISLELLKKCSVYKGNKTPHMKNEMVYSGADVGGGGVTTIEVTTITTIDYYNNDCFVFLYYLHPEIKPVTFHHFLKNSDKYLIELHENENYTITYNKIEYMIEYINVLLFTYYDRIYNNYISPRSIKYILHNTILRLKILNALIHSDIFIFVTQSHYICNNLDFIIKLSISEIEYKLSGQGSGPQYNLLIQNIDCLHEYIDTFMYQKLDYITYNTHDLFLMFHRVLSLRVLLGEVESENEWGEENF